MSQLTQHPAYAQVEDLLDAAGQRYRVLCLLRGMFLFAALLVGTTIAAAILASIVGPGWWARIIAALYLLTILAGFVTWIGKPLFMRPKALDVARMLEGRVPGVHNGLTNMVLLARADDIQSNALLPSIFDEIARHVSSLSLEQSIRFREAMPAVLRGWGLALPLLIVGILVPQRISQGFSQILQPAHFVPVQGKVQILEVTPGNATVIRGRSLDVSATAKGEGDFAGTIYFEDDSNPHPLVFAGTSSDGTRRFTYQREHVDQSTRYRLEIGGTQSTWYTVNAIKQVGLSSLSITVLPPAYTKLQIQTTNTPASDLGKQSITVPLGSKVQMAFALDVPVSAAMLQVGDAAPVPATVSSGGQSFSAEAVLKDESPVSLLLTDGGGQIIAKVPQDPLIIHVTPDAAPLIEMKWPIQDLSVAPTRDLQIEANLKDDYGLTSGRLLYGTNPDEPLTVAAQRTFPDKPTAAAFSVLLQLKPDQVQHGKSIWIQIEATDNRDLLSLASDLGPQTTTGRKIEIRFRDPKQLASEQSQKNSKLRERLEAMLKQQKGLQDKLLAVKAPDRALLQQTQLGQDDLRTTMLTTAQTFEFEAENRVIQKTLQVLAGGAAQEAVTFAKSAATEQAAAQKAKLVDELSARQRRVIQTLEAMLALLNVSPDLTAEAAHRRGGDMDNPKAEFEKLSEALKQFIKEEQRILDQTSSLAKKPVDNFDDKDKKLLDELAMAQEKMDAFMQEKVHDFSNLAEQDMANSSLLRELLETYSEVTMAKDALKDKAVEMAISSEENGLELAKETSSNLEKWLMDKPDRQKWTQEDQLQKTEAPMPELPAELEDMVGELMEQQEDLFDEMEDANANWHDSLDKGAGWDAADGPIDNMSAKGVTGNQLPNNNEMGGRSGEGRSGKSQGEMVEETATGKGGRNTPTRLDPTAFQQGQIKDTSTDPTGGATGGGKLSGQGGAGLEGPVGPKLKEQMQRLTQKQAELRNAAERLNLQYQLGKYDNFKLLESIAIMRRVESDLKANRYQGAMRRKDILLDSMDESRTLLGGQISVQHDTTPTANRKLKQDINDAMKGTLPPAWEGALKEYYKKLGQE